MHPRIALARALIRVGRFIQSASIMVMRDADLVEFSRQTYAQPKDVAAWSADALVAQGLNPDEMALLEKLPRRQGQLLVLGVGGGREAIPLARIGFSVTGLDFVPEMVKRAQENAMRHGLAIKGLVQEISRLDLTPESYDIVWLSARMYSCIPTRRRRTDMLARVREALRPGGYFVCQFAWGMKEQRTRVNELARKTLAWLTLGNVSYEAGDVLHENVEFIHCFSSEQELRVEFADADFKVVCLNVDDDLWRGEALLEKL